MPTATKQCRACKKRKRQEDMVQVGTGWFCTMQSAIDYSRKPKQLDKGRKIKAKEQKRQKREFYEKDIKTRREAAVYWFNRFIRLRDSGSGCISCGACSTDIQYHAGHYIPAGSSSALRFDEQNCHLQCARCNLFRSGALAEYRIGLERKIGIETVQALEGPQPTIKITAEWYKSIEETYKAKCKAIEAEQERAA